MSNRIICDLGRSGSGPLLIAIGGLHGNEQAGIKAIEQFAEYILSNNLQINGRFVGLRGNLKALETGQRYIEYDLNRRWNKEHVDYLNSLDPNDLTISEEREQKELIVLFEEILAEPHDAFLFLDLHTTSAKGGMFTLPNARTKSAMMAMHLRVPVIRGLSETLEGTSLQYFQDLGLPGVGFEAGQHNDPQSVQSILAALCLMFESMSFVQPLFFKDFEKQINDLIQWSVSYPRVVDFKHHYRIKDRSDFKMLPGFVNFQKIQEGELLAHDNGEEIFAKEAGLILMPLYQKQGHDGFFIVSENF